ncbi:MAG TPA: glycosyltransferase family 4 protein [Solirubrobacterales bacterium]|nr:glycosyltransferase family 4 protein [Solirubrobacterales bacterium]
MRVLIFHGYLLSGTGSNVYNASLAKAMRKQGHEVHLLCQDREAAELDFVDAVGDWEGGVLRIREGSDPSGGAHRGSVTVYTPETGGLLPVFVRDRYAGFEVKTYSELTDDELEDYIERNVQAVRDVVAHAGGPDAALANHLVTAPLILDRAGIAFAVKVHGSDLSYTVLPELERFGPMARDGARAAAGILVGSHHIADRLREAVDEPEVNAKVMLGPPGVDTELFDAIPREDGPRRLLDLAEQLEDTQLVEDTDSSWDRDPREAAEAVRWLAGTDGPRVVFVGKLIVSKGIDLLVAAWPLVHARNPEARLILVGFGAYREGVERLIEALCQGDIQGAQEIARRGRELEGGPEKPLEYLSAFLADPPPGYSEHARNASGSIALAGRLEHSEVGRLVPACDALVFPSTHPEAFGMVAAEAASAGVLPVSAAHSGALEVSRELADRLPDEVAGLVSFRVSKEAIESIAAHLNIWLTLEPALKSEARRSLRETAKGLWGWEGVAREVIEASMGAPS